MVLALQPEVLCYNITDPTAETSSITLTVRGNLLKQLTKIRMTSDEREYPRSTAEAPGNLLKSLRKLKLQ